jgi:hypothetical protein
MTDIDLAGQIETRQSTSGTMHYLNGILIHWRGRTKRLIVHTTAAGEYIALSRGNTTAKYIRDIMIFFWNTIKIYYLYTDNQAAEHIATQPNMNDHSRSIDIRIHGIRQDYLDEALRIGGVTSTDNTSDILTENLQPHLHQKHCTHLHISTHRQKDTKPTTNNALQCTPTLTSVAKQETDPRMNHCHPTLVMQKLSGQTSRILRLQKPATHPQQPKVNPFDIPHSAIQREQHAT